MINIDLRIISCNYHTSLINKVYKYFNKRKVIYGKNKAKRS